MPPTPPRPALRPRPARAADLARLAAVEDAGLVLFEQVLGDLSGDPLATPSPSGQERLLRGGTLLVVGEVGSPVGFVHVLPGDTSAHLQQLSVHPDHARQGLGSALVRAAEDDAWQEGWSAMTLTTYRDLPWNGPFYAALGYTEDPAPDAFVRRQRDTERALGLDRHGPRVALRRRLARPSRR